MDYYNKKAVISQFPAWFSPFPRGARQPQKYGPGRRSKTRE